MSKCARGPADAITIIATGLTSTTCDSQIELRVYSIKKYTGIELEPNLKNFDFIRKYSISAFLIELPNRILIKHKDLFRLVLKIY